MELGIRALHPDISPPNHQINSDFNACNMPPFQPIPPHVVQPDAGLQQFLANRQLEQQQQQTQPLPLTTPTLPPLPVSTQGQVMTDEQLETLRRQISVYATICQQLVEMHKAIMAQQSSASALWWGHATAFDASFHGMAHKLTSRQRWTPSQTQLQILERLFEQESGTPSKQRIKEITLELSQHGQISETNVYNWFQNRRARTKRKQQLGGSNNGESEPDTDADSPAEKKGKIEQDDANHVASAPETSRPMQFEVGDSSASCSRGMINENGTSETAHMVDQKVWDIHLPMAQNRMDVRQSTTSQEMQAGLMMMHPVENYH